MSEEHKVQSCREFQSLDLDSKWNVVKENNLCCQCLNSHRLKSFSKKVCDIANCNAKHHPLLLKYSVPAYSNNVQMATSAPNLSVNSHNDRNNKPIFRWRLIRYFNGTKPLWLMGNLCWEGSLWATMDWRYNKMWTWLVQNECGGIRWQ